MAMPLLKILSNAKTRTLVFLVGGVLAGGIIIAIASSGKSGNSADKRTSKTTEIPKGVESIPGGKTSAKYRELQEKANTIGADNAEKKGNTFIPTIVADKKHSSNEDLQNQFLKALSKDTERNTDNIVKMHDKSQPDPRLIQALNQQKQDETDVLVKQKQAQLNAEKMAALNEQRLKAIETVAQAMEEQSKAAFNAWNDIPAQAYVFGDLESTKQGASATDNENEITGNGTIDKRPVLLKAGSILFASLETAVNSDEPGPIMATIVQPPFKDAKLVGKIELPQGNGEKVTLVFDTLNIPTEPASTKINAVAIDPDTARTALATDVDHHYLLRWGTLFGSAFLSGYSKAVSQKGTTITQQTPLGTTNTTTNAADLSGKQQIFQGLSEVGSKWGDQLGNTFNRKPTITIAQGTGIGVLVLVDVKLGPEPIKPNVQQIQGVQQNLLGTNNLDLLTAIIQNASNIKANASNNNQAQNQTTDQTKNQATPAQNRVQTQNASDATKQN